MIVRIILLFIIIAFALSPSVDYVFAEEEAVEESEGEDQENKTNSSPKISSNKRSEVKTLEEFVPSEEVSADKPISFPSDI